MIVFYRYYASTQECSNCHKLNKIPLSQRVYVCNYCGLTIDQDLNSGIDNDAKGHREIMALGTALMPDRTTTVMLVYSARDLVDEETGFSWRSSL